MTVEKISMLSVVVYLGVYVGMHYLIYYLKTEMENKGVASKKSIKNINLLYKWFPAIYVLIIILGFL